MTRQQARGGWGCMCVHVCVYVCLKCAHVCVTRLRPVPGDPSDGRATSDQTARAELLDAAPCCPHSPPPASCVRLSLPAFGVVLGHAVLFCGGIVPCNVVTLLFTHKLTGPNNAHTPREATQRARRIQHQRTHTVCYYSHTQQNTNHVNTHTHTCARTSTSPAACMPRWSEQNRCQTNSQRPGV